MGGGRREASAEASRPSQVKVGMEGSLKECSVCCCEMERKEGVLPCGEHVHTSCMERYLLDIVTAQVRVVLLPAK